MNLLERLADRIHAPHDERARVLHRLTVVRLPGGRRQIFDPRLPELLEARRHHARTHGLDPADQAILGTQNVRSRTRKSGGGVPQGARVTA